MITNKNLPLIRPLNGRTYKGPSDCTRNKHIEKCRREAIIDRHSGSMRLFAQTRYLAIEIQPWSWPGAIGPSAKCTYHYGTKYFIGGCNSNWSSHRIGHRISASQKRWADPEWHSKWDNDVSEQPRPPGEIAQRQLLVPCRQPGKCLLRSRKFQWQDANVLCPSRLKALSRNLLGGKPLEIVKYQ